MEKEVKAINPCRTELADPRRIRSVADGSLEPEHRLHRQPTAAEVSGLAVGLCDSRTHAEELSNQFARLLNRGSSLE